MSDTQRCEPVDPTVDGWHWLQYKQSPICRAEWLATKQEWFFPEDQTHSPVESLSTSWRYLAPVTPPATVAALVEALAECADDLEAEIAARYAGADAYPSEARRKDRDMAPVIAARRALAAYRRQA